MRIIRKDDLERGVRCRPVPKLRPVTDLDAAAAGQNRPMHMLRIVQHVLFTAMTALGVVRSVVGDGITPGELLVAVALLGWYWAGWIAAARRKQSSLRLWLAALSGLCLVAMWVSPDFAWVAFAVFVTFATTLAPAPAVAGIVAMATGTGGVLVGRWPAAEHWSAQIVGPLVGAAAAGALVAVGRVAAAEVAERQRLLDELLTTRDDLARAHLAAGVREERQRLTGEIHDTLAQSFTSVVLAARRAHRAVDVGDTAATVTEIEHIEDLGRGGVDAARRLMHALGPVELDGTTLRSALVLLAAHAAQSRSPIVEVRFDGNPDRLPIAVEAALLRIAQEALANARNHAEAERVVITLTCQPSMVSLDVADDGTGFDPTTAGRHGFGLNTMRHRAEMLGGTLHIDTETEEGSTINASIPIPPPESRPTP